MVNKPFWKTPLRMRNRTLALLAKRNENRTS
jgi:hypothetical protein